jgi:hypothetical protein
MGDPLAYVQYRPDEFVDIDTSSTSFVDADPTNLAITFEAPLSGTVDVMLQALGLSVDNLGEVYWCVRDGSGPVDGTDAFIVGLATRARGTLSVRVAGLTPGDGYAWTWAHRTNNATHAARLQIGGWAGPAIMSIEAAETTLTEVVITDLDFYPGMRVALNLRTLEWAEAGAAFAIYAYGPTFVFSLADSLYADVSADLAYSSEGVLMTVPTNRSIADPTPTTFELYANDSTIVSDDDGSSGLIEVSGILCVHVADGALVWRSSFVAPVFLGVGDSIALDWRPNVTG